jgi:hypothetical protein
MWPESGKTLAIVIFALAAIVFILGIRIEGFHVRLGRQGRSIPLIGMAVSALFFAGFATWYFWLRPPIREPNVDQVDPNLSVDEVKPLSPDSRAFFECQVGDWADADIVKPDSFYVSLKYTDIISSRAALLIGTPPPKLRHDNPNSSANPLRCRIKFYGLTPLFNVRLPIIVEAKHLEATDNPLSTFITSDSSTQVTINQVEIPRSEFTIYVFSDDVNAEVWVKSPAFYMFDQQDGGADIFGRVIASKVIEYNSVFPSPSQSDTGVQR